jgi:dolichol kinase
MGEKTAKIEKETKKVEKMQTTEVASEKTKEKVVNIKKAETKKEEKVEKKADAPKNKEPPKYTKDDLQIPRRLFHIVGGCSVAILYSSFFTYETAVRLLGFSACLFFLFEHARSKYPEYSETFGKIAGPILRAEEHLRESALLPFVMGVLLSIITYPKVIAIASIFVLAVSDPASAIVGIKLKGKKNKAGKSFEGSIAFLVSSFIVIFTTFLIGVPSLGFGKLFLLTLLSSLSITGFERLPLRIDDNFLLPVFSGIILWFFCALLGIPLS